jgi:hypothetical protein
MSFDLYAEVQSARHLDFKERQCEEILGIAEGLLRSEPELMSADEYKQLEELLDNLGC